ncbi:alpha-hydroxy acid oxidase [soil metagenome]
MVTFQSLATKGMATLDDIHATALGLLEPSISDFLEGGAGAETTMRRNREAFDRWAFSQRVMSGLGEPSMSTTFMGVPLAFPVMTAPFGADQLFHPDGQLGVALANEALGLASIVPEAGSYAIEEIAAKASRASRLAQLHPMGRPETFLAMVRRIEDAGFQGICVTVDCPTAGWRERIIRNSFDLEERFVGGNYPLGGDVELSEVFGQLFERGAGVWSWNQLADLMSQTELPWMAKGILSVEDALEAERAGASAVLVSNHGGRQLDDVPASLDSLPAIARAVGGRMQIALDSGVRRGADVVKALALGADIVVIGRLAVYGLTAGGQAGVERVHTLLQDEMRTVLTLLGHGDLTALGPEALIRLDAT